MANTPDSWESSSNTDVSKAIICDSQERRVSLSHFCNTLDRSLLDAFANPKLRSVCLKFEAEMIRFLQNTREKFAKVIVRIKSENFAILKLNISTNNLTLPPMPQHNAKVVYAVCDLYSISTHPPADPVWAYPQRTETLPVGPSRITLSKNQSSKRPIYPLFECVQHLGFATENQSGVKMPNESTLSQSQDTENHVRLVLRKESSHDSQSGGEQSKTQANRQRKDNFEMDSKPSSKSLKERELEYQRARQKIFEAATEKSSTTTRSAPKSQAVENGVHLYVSSRAPISSTLKRNTLSSGRKGDDSPITTKAQDVAPANKATYNRSYDLYAPRYDKDSNRYEEQFPSLK